MGLQSARQPRVGRLDRMSAYFEKESFFGNPDDQRLFREQIAEVRRRWEAADWAELRGALGPAPDVAAPPDGKESHG